MRHRSRDAALRVARVVLASMLVTLATLDSSAQAPAPVSGAAPVNAAAKPRAPQLPWKAAGDVCVRLARFESRASLTARDARLAQAADGARGEIRVARRGDGLALGGAADAAAAGGARELLLEPTTPTLGIELDGAHYRGRLRVRPLGEAGLAVDNLVDLEDYVAGVVAGEVQLIDSTRAELEAQAIASRSFALAQLAARGTRSLEVRLYDGTRDQRYLGTFEPRADPRERRAARDLSAAIEATRGMILVDGGETLDARFHAACGGRTAAARDVFAEAARFGSLASVDCAGCTSTEGPDLSWRLSLGRAELARVARAFGLGASLSSITPLTKDRGGRWLEVELGGTDGRKRASFEAVRRELGASAPGSNLILTSLPRPGEALDANLMLVGRGRGHGVGLCQTGSRFLAARGWSAARILAHYYPGSSLADGRD